MDKLIKLCKAGIYLIVNEHKDYYETVEEFFQDIDDEVDIEIYQKMIKTDTIIDLQFYLTTPVGFYRIYHYDLTKAVEQALKIIAEEIRIKNERR